MKKNKVRSCPKCKSKDIHWSEMWYRAAIGFNQNPNTGELSTYFMNMHPDGEPCSVRGECNDCGHTWTARNARQITDVTPFAILNGK